MKETKPYITKIHVFHVSDGKIRTFEHIYEACRYIDWLRSVGPIGEQFRTFVYTKHCNDDHRRCNVYNESNTIIRDDAGQTVHINDLISLWNSKFVKPRTSWWRYPGANRSMGSYYRHLQSTNERRQSLPNYEAYDDYGIVVQPRGKRNINNLPNSWDDYPRSFTRNWKHSRKTQWK